MKVDIEGRIWTMQGSLQGYIFHAPSFNFSYMQYTMWANELGIAIRSNKMFSNLEMYFYLQNSGMPINDGAVFSYTDKQG